MKGFNSAERRVGGYGECSSLALTFNCTSQNHTNVMQLLEHIIDNLRSDGPISPRSSFDSHSRLATRSLSHHRKRKRASSEGGHINSSLPASLSSSSNSITPTAELLPGLSGELRTYQLSGVRWLGSHFLQGKSTILSDEHQADRQIQAIGTLAFLQSRNIGGPFLIVSSQDLLPSWSSELHRLMPSGLLIHTYDASSSSRDMLGLIAGQRMDGLTRVVLVSHELFHSDRQSLCRHSFKLAVIDSSSGCPSRCLEDTLQQPLSTTNQFSPLLLLLTDTHPARSPSQPIQEIWPFIRMVAPEYFDRLYASVASLHHSIHQDGNGRDQNRPSSCPKHGRHKSFDDMMCDEGVEDEGQQMMADILNKLQTIVDQRVLSRSAAQFDLSLPRRETQTNLYDLFATIDQDDFDSRN